MKKIAFIVTILIILSSPDSYWQYSAEEFYTITFDLGLYAALAATKND